MTAQISNIRLEIDHYLDGIRTVVTKQAPTEVQGFARKCALSVVFYGPAHVDVGYSAAARHEHVPVVSVFVNGVRLPECASGEDTGVDGLNQLEVFLECTPA